MSVAVVAAAAPHGEEKRRAIVAIDVVGRAPGEWKFRLFTGELCTGMISERGYKTRAQAWAAGQRMANKINGKDPANG